MFLHFQFFQFLILSDSKQEAHVADEQAHQFVSGHGLVHGLVQVVQLPRTRRGHDENDTRSARSMTTAMFVYTALAHVHFCKMIRDFAILEYVGWCVHCVALRRRHVYATRCPEARTRRTSAIMLQERRKDIWTVVDPLKSRKEQVLSGDTPLDILRLLERRRGQQATQGAGGGRCALSLLPVCGAAVDARAVFR